MSGPAVAIGYILLVPSILGMLLAAYLFFSVAKTVNTVDSGSRRQVVQRMRTEEVPRRIITAVLNGDTDTVDQWATTSDTAYMDVRVVREAQSALGIGTVSNGAFAALGTGFSLFLGIGSFVGGLLGWLLVMRKKVLQCTLCQATVNAS